MATVNGQSSALAISAGVPQVQYGHLLFNLSIHLFAILCCSVFILIGYADDRTLLKVIPLRMTGSELQMNSMLNLQHCFSLESSGS